MDCWKSSSELKSYVISSLNKLGIRPSRYMGQNFLINPHIINFQIEKADIGPKDIVLEIGGGLGNLTKCIVEKAKKTYVIEMDKKISKFLEERYSSFANFEVITGDAVRIDFPNFTKCVSNLPYQISSPITFKILNYDFDLAILMYQKEFAQRFFAKPNEKDYSRLSVMINLKAECEYLKTVKASSFLPAPKVQSSIISMKRKTSFAISEDAQFGEFVTLLFSHKKKIVRSVLLNTLKRRKKESERISDVKIEPVLYGERRIFTLSLEELIKLYSELKEKVGESTWSDIISQNMK